MLGRVAILRGTNVWQDNEVTVWQGNYVTAWPESRLQEISRLANLRVDVASPVARFVCQDRDVTTRWQVLLQDLWQVLHSRAQAWVNNSATLT